MGLFTIIQMLQTNVEMNCQYSVSVYGSIAFFHGLTALKSSQILQCSVGKCKLLNFHNSVQWQSPWKPYRLNFIQNSKLIDYIWSQDHTCPLVTNTLIIPWTGNSHITGSTRIAWTNHRRRKVGKIGGRLNGSRATADTRQQHEIYHSPRGHNDPCIVWIIGGGAKHIMAPPTKILRGPWPPRTPHFLRLCNGTKARYCIIPIIEG